MLIATLAVLVGFGLLIWSADRFVDGAAATAYHAGMPSLLIGMVIVGFGTSAPEMVVSAMAALDGSPELALGNAQLNFDTGVISAFDLSLSKNQYLAAKSREIQSKFDYLFKVKVLEFYLFNQITL